jgi:hypothetical protein
MIPISLTLEAERGPKHTFHYNVVSDQLFTPLMTYAAILDTIGSYERQNGTATYRVVGKATLRKYDAIAYDNLFSGEQASTGVASYMVAPITYLMANDYEKVDLEALDFTIASSEEPKTATLQRVWLDDPRPRGAHGRAESGAADVRARRSVRTCRSASPPIATRRASFWSRWDATQHCRAAESRLPQQLRSVAQMVRALNSKATKHALHQAARNRSWRGDQRRVADVVASSVLAVLEADRNGGSFNALNAATLGEWEL